MEHPIDLAEERVAVVEAQLCDPGRGRQPLDLDPLLRRIAAEDVRMPGRPHEATVLPRPGDRRIVEDRLGEDDRIKRRALGRAERADGAGEARPVLGAGGHALGHARRLMAGEHEGSAGGVGMDAGRHRADDAHPIGAGGRKREQLAELEARDARRDREERPADLDRRRRLGVEGLVLRRPAGEEDDQARVGPRASGERGGPTGTESRQPEAERGQAPDADQFPPGEEPPRDVWPKNRHPAPAGLGVPGRPNFILCSFARPPNACRRI